VNRDIRDKYLIFSSFSKKIIIGTRFFLSDNLGFKILRKNSQGIKWLEIISKTKTKKISKMAIS